MRAGIGAADVAAQQAQLDLQERQALGDGIVQFSRDEAAFLGHGGLPLQGRCPQALDGAGQVAGDGLQQDAVFVGQHGRVSR
jgi:hypothetical protein